MNEEKLKELLGNEEFLSKIAALETPEEVSAVFQKEGIEITPEELNQIRETLTNMPSEGELSEDQLEDVAGGFLSAIIFTAIHYGILGGIGIGIGETITRRRW